MTAECPTGKKVIGGGFSHDFASAVQVVRSAPITLANGADAWQVDLRTTGDVVTVTAYALCAFAS